jgi:hypothetical protein
VAVPDLPPPPPLPACERCGPGAGSRCFWAEDRLGRRHVRAECARCGGFLTFPPSVPPYSDMADAAASPAPVLDALVGLEAAGAELHSDGRGVWIGDGYANVPPAVRAAVHQAKHQLAAARELPAGGGEQDHQPAVKTIGLTSTITPVLPEDEQHHGP